MHHDNDTPAGGTTPGDDDSQRPTVEHPVAVPPAGAPSGEHTAPPPEHVPASTEQFPPAADHGYVTPPPPPPVTPGGGGGGGGGPTFGPPESEPERRRRRNPVKLVALVALAVVLLGGVAFAGVMLANKTSAAPDAMATMVPASDQLYVTAYLDPGADQKLNLRDLLERFPAMQGKDPAQKLDETLEQALKPTGLSYAQDVKPWLGSQIAVAGGVDVQGQPDVAVMIATKDDQKSLNTMKRLEGLSSNANVTWSSQTYQGVAMRVGQGSQQSDAGGPLGGFDSNPAYAVVDHTLVVATNPATLKGVIDADQGRGTTLSDDANFQKARGALPDEVLGMAYVNVGSLIDQVLPQLEAGGGLAGLPAGCGGDQMTKSLDALRAFRGLAFSATAQTDGLQLDAGLAIDRSKLPSEAATAVASSGHQNAALSFVPQDSYGVLAFEGAGLVNAELSAFGKCQPDVQRRIDQLGVKDVLSNLSGDMTVSVGPGREGQPGGALVAAVKDEGKMRSALDALAGKLASGQAQPTSETYKGVTIESIKPPNAGVEPAWAVTDNVAIIGTTPDDVKAAIDAHAGSDITSSSTFQQAAARIDLSNGSLFYADISKILDAVEQQVPSGELGGFQEVYANLRPLKATILQSGLDGDVLTVRWFFLVP
jgi:hypothetical protein